jgi:hypothetical protein
MAESRDNRYDQARRSFDELDVEEQATFLVEATASTLARGVQTVGEALADRLEEVLRRRRRPSASRSGGPGPAEPETAQRQSPRSGASAADREA